MQPWYENSFGPDYLLVYKHRNEEKAVSEVEQLEKWLHLAPSDIILDLCCGAGRHAIALARHGFHVVGMDLSQTLLTEAVSKSVGVPIGFVYGDMRNLPFVENSFDVIIQMFTSFGYFHDDDNLRVLTEIKRVLKPKGRFLLDCINPGYVLHSLKKKTKRKEKDWLITENRWIEDRVVHKQIILTDGKSSRKYHEQVKMYRLSEMISMLKTVGLLVEDVFGSFTGDPYKKQSERMIIVGTK